MKVFVSYNTIITVGTTVTVSLSVVTDVDLCGRNVLHFNLFPLLRDCSTIAQSYLCRSFEPLSNTTIYSHHLLYTQETLAPVSSAGLAVRRAEVSQQNQRSLLNLEKKQRMRV